MKSLIQTVLLSAALIGGCMPAWADDKDKEEPNVERYNVTTDDGLLAFGKSYYELNGYPVGANGNFYDEAHSDWSIKNWPKSNNAADPAKHLATYLHFPQCSSNAQIQLTTTGPVTFKIKVTCCEDKSVISEKTVTMPAGTKQWINVMDTKQMPQSAWYKFDIECTEGAANVGEFFYWKFDQKTPNTDRVYTADYMSSPSVHLNGWKTTDPKAPTAGRYDWVYQEVMIPEGDDVVGTYAMSLGILHGYMGIQKDSENDYPIIFSMWDNGSTDNDPNLPAYLRSGALDNEDGVTIARFGGEGTGAQAKRRTGQNWKPGQWVKFVANCRPEVVDVEIDDPDNPGQKKTITYTNTLCTAWYMAEGIDNDWQYLATIRQSGANNYFDGWYSFLEDYNWQSGQWARRSYYRNGGLHSMVDGKWYHANQVGFGHTDGGDKYGDRQDYGHGIAKEYDNCFYLYSGGYHESPNDTENTLPLKQNIMPLDEATIQRLTARVDQAIKKEQEKAMKENISNACVVQPQNNFTVTACSDEATNEDKTANGVTTVNRKGSVFDGDENSYWHSKWSGSEAPYPHTLTIEVKNPEEIGQITLYQSRESRYRAKTLTILTSTNGTNWTESETVVFEDANRPNVELTKPINSKYIQLRFDNGYGGNLLCINEIYFKSSPSIDILKGRAADILARKDQFDGYSAKDLAALETAYDGGNQTDFGVLSDALSNLAANGTPLKFGAANSTAVLSSFKAYQFHNVYGHGDAIVSADKPAAAECGKFSVVDDANNWLILRSERLASYYIYNMSAQKYLTYADGKVSLTAEPTPVSIGTRNKTVTVDGKNQAVFEGFTFNLASGNSYLTAANNTSLSIGASNTEGACWELRDNYGLTPDAATVKALLADIEKTYANPEITGTAYAIRLDGTQLYLTSNTMCPGGTRSTFSISGYPEYFYVNGSSASGYTIQSASSGVFIGHSQANDWDMSAKNSTWYIADIEGNPTTINKAASGTKIHMGVDNRTTGAGVFADKEAEQKWVFELYNGETVEPDPEPDTQYYTYKIRSKQNGKYAYINSAAVNGEGVTILGLDGSNATTFTFEGTFEDGYKMSATTASGKQYVYAVDGGKDADSNVGLTTDAEAATIWQFKYVNSNGGRDNYNIVPKGVNRSWNVRGTVEGVSTIGHWYTGNYDGSLWQVEAVSNENISITYNFQGESFGPVSETYNLPKGSFFTKTLPYGVTAETPTGAATESSTHTVPYTVAENYPLALAADVEDVEMFYTLKIRNTKNIGIDAEGGTFVVTNDAESEYFAFVGSPWGMKIYSYTAEAFVGGQAANSENVTATFSQKDAAVYLLEKNTNGYAFRIKGTDNGYLNNFGGDGSTVLGYWFHNSAQNDPGSTFIITEVEIDDPDFEFEYSVGNLVYIINEAIKGSRTVQDVLDVVDEILKRKK